MKIDHQENCEYRFSSILSISIAISWFFLFRFNFSVKRNGQEICFVRGKRKEIQLLIAGAHFPLIILLSWSSNNVSTSTVKVYCIHKATWTSKFNTVIFFLLELQKGWLIAQKWVLRVFWGSLVVAPRQKLPTRTLKITTNYIFDRIRTLYK